MPPAVEAHGLPLGQPHGPGGTPEGRPRKRPPFGPLRGRIWVFGAAAGLLKD